MGRRITWFFPLFFIACSQLNFTSNGKIPVYVAKQPGHHEYFEVKGKREFFFWGLIEDKDKVFIDETLEKQGFESAANIHLETYMSRTSFWYTVLSLGFYIPKEYKITGFGITSDPNIRRIKRREFL